MTNHGEQGLDFRSAQRRQTCIGTAESGYCGAPRSSRRQAYAGKYTRLEVRFRGALCYIEAYKEPAKELTDYWRKSGIDVQDAIEQYRKRPTHLGRLRYFGDNRWSYAFYTYSNERYEATLFPTGDWFGTPEEAFDIGAMYLND